MTDLSLIFNSTAKCKGQIEVNRGKIIHNNQLIINYEIASEMNIRHSSAI